MNINLATKRFKSSNDIIGYLVNVIDEDNVSKIYEDCNKKILGRDYTNEFFISLFFTLAYNEKLLDFVSKIRDNIDYNLIARELFLINSSPDIDLGLFYRYDKYSDRMSLVANISDNTNILNRFTHALENENISDGLVYVSNKVFSPFYVNQMYIVDDKSNFIENFDYSSLINYLGIGNSKLAINILTNYIRHFDRYKYDVLTNEDLINLYRVLMHIYNASSLISNTDEKIKNIIQESLSISFKDNMSLKFMDSFIKARELFHEDGEVVSNDFMKLEMIWK